MEARRAVIKRLPPPPSPSPRAGGVVSVSHQTLGTIRTSRPTVLRCVEGAWNGLGNTLGISGGAGGTGISFPGHLTDPPTLAAASAAPVEFLLEGKGVDAPVYWRGLPAWLAPSASLRFSF